jgi:hypothetical protein
LPGFRQSAVVLIATVLAGILLSLAIQQFRQLRLAERDVRVGHAYWLLLQVGFATWMFSIALWTLDNRQRYLPVEAWPFVGVTALCFVTAFVIGCTQAGGQRAGQWLARLRPPRL